MAMYNKNYGQVLGGPQPAYSQGSEEAGACGPGGQMKPQAPPSWGYIPDSVSTASGMTLVPQSGSSNMYGSSAGYSQDMYSQDFTQAAPYKTPAEEARDVRRKLDRKDKKKKNKRQDAKTAAEWLLFLGIFNALMWTVPIFGMGWHKKEFMGIIEYTEVRTGLLSISIDVKCTVMQWGLGIDSDAMAKLGPSHQICKVFQHFSGTHSMKAAKELACAADHNACNIMSNIYISSFCLIFAYVVSALLSFIAALFLYFYWYQEHLKKVRNWAFALYIVSPTWGILAFGLYNLLSPDIGDLPRSWTAMVQTMNMGTGLGELRAINESSFLNKFGWCWYFSYITFAFAIAAPVSWALWFNKHNDEKLHELNAENELLELEDAIDDVHKQEDHVVSGTTPQSNDAWGAQQYAGAAYPPQQNAYGAYPQQQMAQSGGYGAYPQQQAYPMISY